MDTRCKIVQLHYLIVKGTFIFHRFAQLNLKHKIPHAAFTSAIALEPGEGHCNLLLLFSEDDIS